MDDTYLTTGFAAGVASVLDVMANTCAGNPEDPTCVRAAALCRETAKALRDCCPNEKESA